jgi:hypothetical protein
VVQDPKQTRLQKRQEYSRVVDERNGRLLRTSSNKLLPRLPDQACSCLPEQAPFTLREAAADLGPHAAEGPPPSHVGAHSPSMCSGLDPEATQRLPNQECSMTAAALCTDPGNPGPDPNSADGPEAVAGAGPTVPTACPGIATMGPQHEDPAWVPEAVTGAGSGAEAGAPGDSSRAPQLKPKIPHGTLRNRPIANLNLSGLCLHKREVGFTSEELDFTLECTL